MRVTLARGDEEAVGFAEGSIASSCAPPSGRRSRPIDALRQLQKAAECLDIDSAQIVRVGIQDVAIVTVVFVVPPAEQMVSGSAIVRDHLDPEAIVRAVLDATNRRPDPPISRVSGRRLRTRFRAADVRRRDAVKDSGSRPEPPPHKLSVAGRSPPHADQRSRTPARDLQILRPDVRRQRATSGQGLRLQTASAPPQFRGGW